MTHPYFSCSPGMHVAAAFLELGSLVAGVVFDRSGVRIVYSFETLCLVVCVTWGMADLLV